MVNFSAYVYVYLYTYIRTYISTYILHTYSFKLIQLRHDESCAAQADVVAAPSLLLIQNSI